ncbi:hypothetical protein TIFTF001_007129 [Ficus carica]|uniref:Uncharacterized protein n=1 Tax=Ficus carica TaxID=3494 RepID=A0AA87ZR03_FICCA|nr:hypothetical protein TIFTF001_007129 [Ficus carica]
MSKVGSEEMSKVVVKLGALGLALLVALVSVARAFVLVAVSPRRNALALLAAYPTVLHAPVQHSRF